MLSVIIPTFNEETSIQKLLQYLKRYASESSIELIVSDGGSTDNTVKLANMEGAKVIHSKKGRATQMNAGAQIATGKILYFLHADTFPPHLYAEKILNVFSPNNKAGCFRLRFDHSHPFLNMYGWFTKFNITYFRFGDQSLFVDNDLFQKIGGFNEDLMVMEDQEMVRSLIKITGFKVLDSHVITSARKYLEVGIIRLQLIFTLILIMYYLGFSQERLMRCYQKLVHSLLKQTIP